MTSEKNTPAMKRKRNRRGKQNAKSSPKAGPQTEALPTASNKAHTTKNRQRTNRSGRRPSEYDSVDNGGVVSRSKRPRPVVLSFESVTAGRLLAILESADDTEIRDYVYDKIEWTKRYNNNNQA